MVAKGKSKVKLKANKKKAGKKAVKDHLAGEPEAFAQTKAKKAPKKKVPKKKVPPKTTPKKSVPKKKAPKKTAAKNEAGESEEKCAPAKQRRIRASDVVGENGEGKAIVPELDPFEVAKQTMRGSVPAIVEAMVELAKQGSCTHAKTLLEMTGAKHMFDSETEARDSGEPWAKLVLQRLDEAELAAEQGTVTLQEELRELVAEPG